MPVPDGDQFESRLRALLARLPDAPRLQGVQRLTGGASQETWLLHTTVAAGAERLILRRSPGGRDVRRDAAAGLDQEAAALGAAAAAHVPVPPLVHVLRVDDGLGAGFITRFVEGETIPRRILREPRHAAVRDRLARQSGETLARIHAIDTAALPGLRLRGARARLDALDSQYRAQQLPRPVFELAFRWLRAQLPAAEPRPCLVHGDFRNGNLIIGERGIAAVLDWELAHLGDPVEDLGWFCTPSWRFGALDRPAGGFGSIDELLEGYAAAGGAPVDRERLRYWTVFGSLFWGVTCVEFALEFRRGDRDIERATIGRRASEAELDLLWLLDPQGPARA